MKRCIGLLLAMLLIASSLLMSGCDFSKKDKDTKDATEETTASSSTKKSSKPVAVKSIKGKTAKENDHHNNRGYVFLHWSFPPFLYLSVGFRKRNSVAGWLKRKSLRQKQVFLLCHTTSFS